MKKILGLDLGTNSIGWALVNVDDNLKPQSIAGMGSRIIPMDAATLSDFDKGNSKSQTAERTGFRGTRRLRERHLLRRERLHRILFKMDFLPEHYVQSIDFENRLGQFLTDTEPKIAWRKNEGNPFEFIFKKSFNEMLAEFSIHQPGLVSDNKKIPYDWTIYYLRKKALERKIEKEELAWILLNFNQKRGYYQLRGEDDEDATRTAKTRKYFDKKIIKNITDTGEDYKGLKILHVELKDGNIGKIFKKEIPDWFGLEKNIIVTVDLDKDGNDRFDENGLLSQRFSIPTDAEWETEWKLIKLKTEKDLSDSNKTVGSYIYDTLLQKPFQKINGKLVRTIERKFYKKELKSILEKQKEFHPELNNEDLYVQCINEIYPSNEPYRNSIANRDFTYLFLDDIIFYQRPLKSKKSLISDCPYEERYYVDKETREKKVSPIKCVAKSHPLFQEFRLWQFISNLKIYKKDITDVEVTSEFLKSEDDYVNLFEWLNDRKEVDQKAFLKYPVFGLKKNAEQYRWNYVEEKPYPCNTTRNAILSKLNKSEYANLTQEIEIKIWQLLFSVNSKEEIDKALKENPKREKRKIKHTQFGIFQTLNIFFSLESIDKLKKINFYETDYGSYSAKAIKKLLTLMRRGKYWDENSISVETKNRVDAIIERLESIQHDSDNIDKIADDDIQKQILKSFKNCKESLTGLNTYQACYAVYNRHSEAKEILKWEKPEDIDGYLKSFKQHSLRNPIVEQVITETLRVVRDIWEKYGDFAEIHVELGREMKNPADTRKRMTNQISENENTNIRIKKLLMEFLNPEFGIENVRPYSPSQQEILRIYEDGALNNGTEIPDYVLNILKKFRESDDKKQPSRSDIVRYKLWLEQNYRSPYTNQVIPLAKLFTSEYQVEHIIPQSRFFDDSFSNKVICESEVNQLKDNNLGFEFIKNHHGEKVELSFGKIVEILSVDAYEQFVKDYYSGNRSKMKKLLMDEIPNDFIERQLNDSRYISKVVKRLLSNIVREDGEVEATSKRLIPCTGSITDRLKKDWGLNNVWNNLVYSRFERLNELTNSRQFGFWEMKDGKRVFQTQMPIELQKGFNKKRIDHRHHSMDALVIACATRSHVNYLNNESAKANAKETRYDLRRKLRRIEKVQIEKTIDGKKVLQTIDVAKEFYKPWKTFTQDAQVALERIVISFKQNLRVIKKTSNYYMSFKDGNGNLRLDKSGKPKKEITKQINGENWSIRKSLHTPMPYSKKEYSFDVLKIADNVGKADLIIDNYIRGKIKNLLTQFNGRITETQKYLKKNPLLDDRHMAIYSTPFKIGVEKYRRRQPLSKLANRGQGGIKTYEDMVKFINKIADFRIQQDLLIHLKHYNNDIDIAFSSDGLDAFNKNRKIPVYNIPVVESGTGRFVVGNRHNTKHKYVEADKGTNLFFAIYQTEEGKRNYETIPLNIIIERQKIGLQPAPEKNEAGDILLYCLSPTDLVYLPTSNEIESGIDPEEINKDRIYKMVSCTGNEGHFIPACIANPIVQTIELGSNNKAQRAWTNEMIKETCVPLKVNRIGEIVEINGKKLF